MRVLLSSVAVALLLSVGTTTRATQTSGGQCCSCNATVVAGNAVFACSCGQVLGGYACAISVTSCFTMQHCGPEPDEFDPDWLNGEPWIDLVDLETLYKNIFENEDDE